MLKRTDQYRGPRCATNPRAHGLLSALAVALLCSPAPGDNHLLISEVVAMPSEGEFIEVYNPLNVAIDLSNYYLADNPLYARITCCMLAPAPTDFIARFPAGATIAAGDAIVIAMNADGFIATYGVSPDFEMSTGANPAPDLIAPYNGAVGFSRSISDAGESIILFHWNGLSDLVQDVDIIRPGMPAGSDGLQNKGALAPIDGPDADARPTAYQTDALTMPTMTAIAGAGFSYKRLFLEGTTEFGCGGNGITGHDETTENIGITWDGSGIAFTAPTPGLTPALNPPPGQCVADIVRTGTVDVDDLLAVITGWGACGDCNTCAADIAPATCLDCVVDVDDLLAVITGWGPCS